MLYLPQFKSNSSLVSVNRKKLYCKITKDYETKNMTLAICPYVHKSYTMRLDSCLPSPSTIWSRGICRCRDPLTDICLRSDKARTPDSDRSFESKIVPASNFRSCTQCRKCRKIWEEEEWTNHAYFFSFVVVVVVVRGFDGYKLAHGIHRVP